MVALRTKCHFGYRTSSCWSLRRWITIAGRIPFALSRLGIERSCRCEGYLLSLLPCLTLLPFPSRFFQPIVVLLLRELARVVQRCRVIGAELTHLEEVDEFLQDVRVSESFRVPNVLVHGIPRFCLFDQLQKLGEQLVIHATRRRVRDHKCGRRRLCSLSRDSCVVCLTGRFLCYLWSCLLGDRYLHAPHHARLRFVERDVVERAAQRCRRHGFLGLVVVEIIDNRQESRRATR
mmetsp:Transcript_28238/g.70090  ORF Transcript_28238/g.70090 Transcript_28238/m.70090 type:complete len:234 (+) Transcript_28238:319-1020(+)